MTIRAFALSALSSSLVLAGCSVLEPDRIDYKSATQAPTLEVPPDLTALSRDSRYVVPSGNVTASAYKAGSAQAGIPVAVSSISDVRIERSGNQRWLVVSRPADQLWSSVRDFWQENGFLLTIDRPDIGVMETDWAENRAKIPQDFVRATIGKVFDALYDSGERDKFRTRLERNGNNTEIYITHRGMVEKLVGGTSAQNADRTQWEPRPSDSELEAEMLRRLMLKLGISHEQSKALIATGAPKPTSRVAQVDGIPVVQIDDGFDRAWRRVGVSLDRTGFTVEDRNRAEGIYFVRFVEAKPDNAKESGFFGKLFGASSNETAPLKYRIAVRSQGESSTVSVLNTNGTPESSQNAQRIVKILADDLR